MSETITCPSGLTGRIRGMKAREERILADRKLARSGAQLEQILTACWEETLDAGPTTSATSRSTGARSCRATASLRCCACAWSPYGPDYAFAVPCENRGCQVRIEWELDLRELPVRALSDEPSTTSSF